MNVYIVIVKETGKILNVCDSLALAQSSEEDPDETRIEKHYVHETVFK